MGSSTTSVGTIITSRCLFMELPTEIRMHIFEYLLEDEYISWGPKFAMRKLARGLTAGLYKLYSLNKQIYFEAKQVFFDHVCVHLEIDYPFEAGQDITRTHGVRWPETEKEIPFAEYVKSDYFKLVKRYTVQINAFNVEEDELTTASSPTVLHGIYMVLSLLGQLRRVEKLEELLVYVAIYNNFTPYDPNDEDCRAESHQELVELLQFVQFHLEPFKVLYGLKHVGFDPRFVDAGWFNDYWQERGGILDVYVKSLEAFLTRPDSKFGLTLVEEQYYVLLQNASTLRYNEDQSLYAHYDRNGDSRELLSHPSRFTIQASFEKLIGDAKIAQENGDINKLRALNEEMMTKAGLWAQQHPIRDYSADGQCLST